MTARCAAGDLVVAWLEANKRSQDWLAKKLGVARSVLWRWLSGQRQPRADKCVAIEAVTGVPVSAWLPVTHSKSAA